MKTIIKFIGKKNAIFVIKHYSKWDISSRILLDKIINKYTNNDNIQFIFINDTNLTDIKFPTYRVSNFSREDSSSLLKKEIKNITDMQVKTIFSILNGEIDHTLHAIDIINLHGYSNFIQQLDNIEYISKTITNAYSKQDSQKLVELLKRASVIGNPAHKKLLFKLTEYQRSLFLHMIDIATKNDYLIDCEKSVQFSDKDLYNLFKNIVALDKELHSKLAICIKTVFPTDFEYRSTEYKQAGDVEMYNIYKTISLLAYMRDNRISIPEDYVINSLNTEYYSFYCHMITAYTHYYNSNYPSSLNELNAITSQLHPLLEFEKQYLICLIKCNNSNDLADFVDPIRNLEVLTSSEYIQDEPEMYLRSAILLLEMYYEVGNMQAHADLYKSILKIFNAYEASDLRIKDIRFFLMARSSITNKIEISYENVKEAYNYFRNELSICKNYSKYFISATNLSAQSLIMGDYNITSNVFAELMEVQNSYSMRFGCNIPIINNFILSMVFEYNYNITAIDDAIKIYELCLDGNSDDVEHTLLKINLSSLLFIKGINTNSSEDKKQAIKIISTLFEHINYNNTYDPYYKYFIINNYSIMKIMSGDKSGVDLLRTINQYEPLLFDSSYFNYRNNLLVEYFSYRNSPDISMPNWNDIKQRAIGKAWGFWGKYLLFTDIEFWTA